MEYFPSRRDDRDSRERIGRALEGLETTGRPRRRRSRRSQWLLLVSASEPDEIERILAERGIRATRLHRA